MEDEKEKKRKVHEHREDNIVVRERKIETPNPDVITCSFSVSTLLMEYAACPKLLWPPLVRLSAFLSLISSSACVVFCWWKALGLVSTLSDMALFWGHRMYTLIPWIYLYVLSFHSVCESIEMHNGEEGVNFRLPSLWESRDRFTDLSVYLFFAWGTPSGRLGQPSEAPFSFPLLASR